MAKASTKRSRGKSTGFASAGAAPRKAGGDARVAMVAVAAYYRAEKRGFRQGAELDDWLAAEKEIRERTSHPG